MEETGRPRVEGDQGWGTHNMGLRPDTIHCERTLRCLEGGVNRQSVAKKHFKTVSHRVCPKTLGISPKTPGFVFGVSGAFA